MTLREVILVGLSAILFVFIGFFMGHNYTAKRAPSISDVHDAEKLISMTREEIQKNYKDSYSIGYNVVTTLRGPVLRISGGTNDNTNPELKKFKMGSTKEILIRDEITNKVLSHDKDGQWYNEDFEKIRPLAQEIAQGLIGVNQQTTK